MKMLITILKESPGYSSHGNSQNTHNQPVSRARWTIGSQVHPMKGMWIDTIPQCLPFGIPPHQRRRLRVMFPKRRETGRTWEGASCHPGPNNSHLEGWGSWRDLNYGFKCDVWQETGVAWVALEIPFTSMAQKVLLVLWNQGNKSESEPRSASESLSCSHNNYLLLRAETLQSQRNGKAEWTGSPSHQAWASHLTRCVITVAGRSAR